MPRAEMGADVTKEYGYGKRTALSTALEYRRAETARTLLELGADGKKLSFYNTGVTDEALKVVAEVLGPEVRRPTRRGRSLSPRPPSSLARTRARRCTAHASRRAPRPLTPTPRPPAHTPRAAADAGPPLVQEGDRRGRGGGGQGVPAAEVPEPRAVR